VDGTAQRFRAAAQAHDHAAIADLLAADVRFFSPVKLTPFEGRAMVHGLLGVVMNAFEDFRYVGELHGWSRTAAEPNASQGTAADPDAAEPDAGVDAEVDAEVDHPEADVLIFRATIRGLQVHGIDLLQYDADGRINEFTVMVRPRSAVTALSEAVHAGLVAAGLIATGRD
jgi:uncharacterized protein with FMN-binding domain